VANERPDLYAALIAEVPFVDVLNTMLDDTLPLTPPEWAEWGNRVTDPAAFRKPFAPIRLTRTCARRITPPCWCWPGSRIPRVTYWEPPKWRSAAAQPQDRPQAVVLRVNLDAGHAGAPGRFECDPERVALGYAFAICGRRGGLPGT